MIINSARESRQSINDIIFFRYFENIINLMHVIIIN